MAIQSAPEEKTVQSAPGSKQGPWMAAAVLGFIVANQGRLVGSMA